MCTFLFHVCTGVSFLYLLLCVVRSIKSCFLQKVEGGVGNEKLIQDLLLSFYSLRSTVVILTVGFFLRASCTSNVRDVVSKITSKLRFLI